MSASVFGTVPEEVLINFEAHDGQLEVIEGLQRNFAMPADEQATIIEIIASRAWGKTLFLCSIIARYLDDHPNAKVMWVAPTYLVAMSPIDDVFRGVNEETGEHYIPEFDAKNNRVWEFVTTKSGPILKWWNGSTITFRSADAPDSIVSKGYNFIVIDEAALIEERVFTLQILGTARKAGIKIFMITTPRGKKHWTYRFFLKGQDANQKKYLSFQQPYTKNPHFNKTLSELIKDIPDWLFQQEYMAKFIEDGDSVFRGIEHILLGDEIQYPSQQQEWAPEIGSTTVPQPDGTFVTRESHQRSFVVSMDIAKSIDYTVLTGLDLETGEVVYYRRLNKTDYREVLTIASAACRRLNGADLIFDATGVGAGIADMLNDYDVTAHPFIFTNDSKTEIVNKLILSVEYQQIKIPNITTIKNELSVFTYTLTRTGKISYNAPAGFHDDIVMSLAMGNWYRSENSVGEHAGVLEDIISHNSGPDNRQRSVYDDMMDDND